ncbi:hypothetical protein DIPPA_29632 [Diplonema papillatum]|nr:hypothetical protein DIPPA_29632 [Diplonema papillatum]
MCDTVLTPPPPGPAAECADADPFASEADLKRQLQKLEAQHSVAAARAAAAEGMPVPAGVGGMGRSPGRMEGRVVSKRVTGLHKVSQRSDTTPGTSCTLLLFSTPAMPKPLRSTGDFKIPTF